MTSIYDPQEAATPSQRLAIAARQARLHRFSTAAYMPVAERLPGPPPLKTLPPIPNKEIAEASKIAFPKIILNRIDLIQRVTLREFPDLTLFDLKSIRREAKIVKARQIAMFIAKKMTSQSLPEIGRRFGRRDHTTVLHAVRKIERLEAQDAALSELINRIKTKVEEMLNETNSYS